MQAKQPFGNRTQDNDSRGFNVTALVASGATISDNADGGGLFLTGLRIEGAGIPAGTIKLQELVGANYIDIMDRAGALVTFTTALATARHYKFDPFTFGACQNLKAVFSAVTTGDVNITFIFTKVPA